MSRKFFMIYLFILCIPTIAQAEEAREHPHCRAAKARAHSEAYLLYSPRLSTQLLHVPRNGDYDGSNAFTESGYQVRASVSFSPLDVYRGTTTVDAAEASCERFMARDRLHETLRQGPSYGKAGALGAQIAYLEKQLPRVDAIVHEGERRLAEQIATVWQVDQLRQKQLQIRLQHARLRHEHRQLEERGLDEVGSTDLSTDLASYEASTMLMERHRSTLRRINPWRLGLRLGIVPDEETDWFGMVELSYNLGGIFQVGAERRYMEARREELRTAPGELQHEVDSFRRSQRLRAEELREELALLEGQLQILSRQAQQLEQIETNEAHHYRALRELEQIAVQARRVLVHRLLDHLDSTGALL
jgi:hypothetical protein